MPFPSQQGDVADRLRKFFRSVGRIQTSVDEVVVPTARVQALDEPPYRGNVANFSFLCKANAIAVGTFQLGGIYLPPGTPGVAVVTQIIIANNQAAAGTFDIIVQDNPNLMSNFVSSQVYNIEDLSTSVAPGGFGQLPPVGYTASLASGAPGAEYLARLRILSATSLVVPINYVLRAGMKGDATQSRTVCVLSVIDNQRIDFSFFGTYYPDAR